MKTKSFMILLLALALVTGCRSTTPPLSGKKQPSIPSEDALFQKAESLYEQKKFDQAIQHYLNYTTHYPKGPMFDAALLKLGIVYREIGRNDQALNYFKQLISKPAGPLAMDARIEILAVYLNQGKFGEVERGSSDILNNQLQETQRMRVYKILGDNYAAANDPVKAVKYYDQMLQLASKSSRDDAFDRIQSVVDRLNNEQTKQLLGSLSDSGARSHLLFHLGNLNYTEKKLADAEAVFKELAEKFPDFKANDRVLQLLDFISSGEIFKPFTLGCLLPLSGSYAAYGQRALQGIELALIEFSKNVPDLTPKLIVEDTQSDPEQAVYALKKMAKEGVAAIIGPMVTADQVAMEADAIGVPIIALTQKEYITDSGPYVFRNFITPEMQIKSLVNYASKTLEAKRFAILYPQENYGLTFMDLFWDEVVVYNGVVVGVESYNTNQTDFAEAIKKLVGLYYPMSQDSRNQALAHATMLRDPEEALKFFGMAEVPLYPDGETKADSEMAEVMAPGNEPDAPESIVDFNAVFIPDSPKKVGLIIPQLAFYDIRKVYLLGTNIWHSESLIRMSRKYLSDAVVVDGFFAESESPHIRKFVSDFSDIYDETPEIIAATAYDSALIVLNLLRDPSVTLRAQVKDRLLSMPPYDGVTGKTAFRPNGDVSKDLFILGIRGGRFVELGRLNPYPVDIQLSSGQKSQISN